MSDAIISAAGLRIVKLLVGKPPQSVADLIKATAVTRTAISEQLNELVRSGFVETEVERTASRGRPRYLYRATNAGSLVLYEHGNCRVVPAIWDAIAAVGGDELLRKVTKKVSKRVAEQYSPKITAKKPEDRLRQMVEALNSEGGVCEVVQKNGRPVLHKRSCPFVGMGDEKRSICCVDLEAIGQVVGKPVRRTASRKDGAPCCTFEIPK
jgi:DeoR family transcriptional regulator, suf operon transcriptional repressor